MKLLEESGYTLRHNPDKVNGEIVVINTCGFIGDAKEESINMILEVCDLKRKRRVRKVFVMGCLSERYMAELGEEIPQVDKYYGKFDWANLVKDLKENLDEDNSQCSTLASQLDRVQTTPQHYAYVKISEGCDRTCAYCAIPIITGHHVSRPMEEIVKEVRLLVGQGVTEIQLIAQDLTYYGVDLYKKQSIAELVERISDVEGVKWIRLHYGYPTHFPMDLLRVMRERGNVCKYLDIALQHVSTDVLKRMRRNITKEETINLLQAIDFSSKRALGMWGGDMSGVPTNKDISLQSALSQVQKMMADASVGKEELVLLYGHELDADIDAMIESVDDIMRTVGDNEFILNKMTLDDLTTLDNVVKTIKHAVTQMNKFHIVNHAKGIANLAQEEIGYAEKLGKAKIYKDKSIRSGARKLLAWKNINPYYGFKRFGEAGKKIFEAFQDGYDKFAFNIKKIIDFTKTAYKREEVREWEKEIKSFELRMPATEEEIASPDYKPRKQEVKMTVAQIMDLYLLNKREAAKRHLLGGGIRVADIEVKGGEVIAQGDGVLLEQSEIDKIISTLTPRQIEVANALSKFMNTTTTDWGNEVSMARFGYRAFGEQNYVPMQVDKNNLAVDDETEKNNSLFRLLNMSFTKSLTEGANNRLVVSSIFDVFAQHASDMAKYNALALPVLDAFRWYNYKEKGYAGETAYDTKSVKQAIENAFGKDGQSYITTFLKDLNGQENTSRDTLGNGFFTKAKIAAVGANLRVALLQPTAYLRASANIAPKYLVKGIGLHKPKTAIELAEKYCGMALWKSMGYFDTSVQRGVADQIKHAESPYDRAVEMSMKGAELGDKITFGYLWNAAELEIRERRQDLKVGSEEFYVEVGKRLRDIIYSTQVVDSVMTRSEMMRSPDRFDKFVTTFASEPTLSYSMLADAVLQARLDARELGSKKAAIAKNKKHMARVLAAYTTTNLAAALVESIFDILRDNDDDDEEDAWELVKLYLENFFTNLSITAKIPWIKELVSIAQGFSSSRLDTQGFQAFVNTFNQVMKIAQGEGSWGKTIKSGVQSASYLSGLPFYNAYRDTLAFIALLTPEELDEILKEFY